ncbi:hypothetical protein DAPPUDRAFT_262741 [Daphnia pulex]|uniref:Uncharacterized protein n=1 Tax=Daphnia pulex TaxID=6669 RepID=E9HNL0_DAPPU|nr:hypothetical protein DAPPUDRAFT_262741 [Daphnia pulex]|eukprot:EFX66696.1 hypothetical protein DAPPUDRAFT_262741 [Daphnia pulex]
MTRGSGPANWPESSSLFGFSAAMPATLFLHLDHWPTGGCRINSFQVEKEGPVLSSPLADHSHGSWNTLASNLNPDEQPMLKVSDFLEDETNHLKLTASSDSGVHHASYAVRRMSGKKVEYNGTAFEVVPMLARLPQEHAHSSRPPASTCVVRKEQRRPGRQEAQPQFHLQRQRQTSGWILETSSAVLVSI